VNQHLQLLLAIFDLDKNCCIVGKGTFPLDEIKVHPGLCMKNMVTNRVKKIASNAAV